MASVSRLGRQLEEVMATLQEIGGDFALIGGLALASHKVIRATQDIDLLADADVADRVDAAVTRLGCRSLHRSDREPYEVLDDLMSVIEVLCPNWPRRGTFIDSGSFPL